MRWRLVLGFALTGCLTSSMPAKPRASAEVAPCACIDLDALPKDSTPGAETGSGAGSGAPDDPVPSPPRS